MFWSTIADLPPLVLWVHTPLIPVSLRGGPGGRGRRGLHCWVCDRAARTLSDEARPEHISPPLLRESGVEINLEGGCRSYFFWRTMVGMKEGSSGFFSRVGGEPSDPSPHLWRLGVCGETNQCLRMSEIQLSRNKIPHRMENTFWTRCAIIGYLNVYEVPWSPVLNNCVFPDCFIFEAAQIFVFCSSKIFSRFITVFLWYSILSRYFDTHKKCFLCFPPFSNVKSISAAE